MITSRAAKECGQADYGWLQARYTFSFGHYFDPQLLGYASLRVLNQEVLAPGASFQPRSYPKVDILNLILQGEAEYRDSEGNHTSARAGEALLLSAQAGVTWSEHNLSKDTPLTRLQLWLDACPERENALIQRVKINTRQVDSLLASPDGVSDSLQLRQQVWIHHIDLQAGESWTAKLHGPRAYLQSIHGALQAETHSRQRQALTCGDGAFLQEEASVTLTAETPLRALVIDLPV
ncbi:redox-sensitive bicupin YhaK (pirin superfamily) [Erwinia toletana]|uniref:Redox-sensitive bicupin YhaK (Pirin superfamily) n=1 Tax=Winslowiella toletana TaxID=92490 RepID=A0ABS4P8C4_9GAMM|nr:pirin family protein [Winslowiella toletana]MBP2168412.1 redox-sensitive bicupin YhaK (pirin superfamily) [Winslowiella toletana]